MTTMRMRRATRAAAWILLATTMPVAACAKKPPAVTRPAPPAGVAPARPAPTPEAPAQPVAEQPIVTPGAVAEDAIGARSLDDLNRESPFRPAFFGLDSAEIDSDAQAVLNQNAGVLRKYATWVVTIEGHCDERGTAEYNLALGEKRALAAKTYLVSLGIDGDRMKTVSYGKEFPFAPEHTDAAWAKNRRAHFVITSK